MKRILLAFSLLLAPSAAWAQCSGVFLNGTVCGNATGANATPRMTTFDSLPISSAQLDALLGSTKGMVAYRNATVWAGFPNGTGVLANDGVGNLSWSAAGSGTVTSISQGTGMVLTPNPITNTGSVAIDPSTAAGLAAGTANKVVTADVAVAAPNFVALTPGATVTPDLDTGYNFTLVPNQSFTLANPVNATGKLGRSFCIVVSNGTPAESITWGSEYYAVGGTSALTLTEVNTAKDMICALVYTTSEFFVFLSKNFVN